MTTFNEFKNTTQILKKYLQKMNSITECDIRPQWIQQNFLRQNNPHIFLQLLHYILIKFSPSVIFVKILDFYPTIKDDNDKKFVTNSMSFGRKMFDLEGKIDVEQFLSQKFVEKKTEWMSQFCKSIHEWYLKESKLGTENKFGTNTNVSRKENQLSGTNVPIKLPTSNKYKSNDDDSQDQIPRNFNIAPSSTKRPIINKKSVQQSSSDEDLKELMTKKKELDRIKQRTSNITVKPNTLKGIVPGNSKKTGNVFIKTIQRDDEQTSQQNQFINLPLNANLMQKNLPQSNKSTSYSQPPTKLSSQQQKIQTSQSNYHQSSIINQQYVTREQFMQIITDMTKNFTQLLTKFNDFQSQVGGWVQNVNAKISILQENVKTIKNNL